MSKMTYGLAASPPGVYEDRMPFGNAIEGTNSNLRDDRENQTISSHNEHFNFYLDKARDDGVDSENDDEVKIPPNFIIRASGSSVVDEHNSRMSRDLV